MFIKNKKGFTLIELVVVIAILGILAGIAIPRFMNSRASAQGAKLLADLRALDSAITVYQARNSAYPENLEVLATEGYVAVIPAPPTGGILITTNSGTEKNYTAADAAYVLNNERATYTSSELSKGNVEQYLEGDVAGATPTNPSPSTVGNWTGKDYSLGDKVIGSDGVIYENMNTAYDSNTDPGTSGYNYYAWKAVGSTDGNAIALTDSNTAGKAFAEGVIVSYNGNYYKCNGNVDGSGTYDSQYKNDGVKFDANNSSNSTKL